MFAVEIFCTYISSLMLAIVHLFALLACASLGLRKHQHFSGRINAKKIFCVNMHFPRTA